MKRLLTVFVLLSVGTFIANAGPAPGVTEKQMAKHELKKFVDGIDLSNYIVMAEQEVISVPCVEIGTIEFIYIGLKSLYMKPVDVCVNSPPAPGNGPTSFNRKLFTMLNRKFLTLEYRWRQSKYS